MQKKMKPIYLKSIVFCLIIFTTIFFIKPIEAYATVTFSGSDSDLDYSQTSISRMVEGKEITFSGGTGAGGLAYDAGGLYAYESTSGGNDIKLTIKAPDGWMFDISSFKAISELGTVNVGLTYANGEMRTDTINGVSTTSLDTVTPTTAIKYVTQVVLSSSEHAVFQDFGIQNVDLIPAPPTAVTNDASGITTSSAILNATVNDGGGDTIVWFQYGTSIAYGSSTAETTIPAGVGETTVSIPASGLSQGTTYHYRVMARNAKGDETGADKTFTTLSVPTISTITLPSNGTYKAGDTLEFTVNYSKNVTVTGTPYISINVGGTSVNAAYVSGSGSSALTFRYTVEAGQNDLDGIALNSPINLNGGTLLDSDSIAADLTFTAPDTTGIKVDNTAPTVSITSPTTTTTNTSPITVTITFSEDVTGFEVSDITVSNGTAGSFSGSGTTYTVDITPAAQGTVTVDVAGGVALDAAGNTNTAATQFSRLFDSVAPTATITSTVSGSTSTSPIPITITFSEDVTGFSIGDITVSNGTVGSFSGSGTTYTADITPSGAGAVTIDVAGGVALDAAGNNNTAASQLSITYVVNHAPTLSTTTSTPTYTEGGASVSLFSGTSVTIGSGDTGQTLKQLSLTVSNVSDGSSEVLTIDGTDVALTNGNSIITSANGVNCSVSVAGSTAIVTLTRSGNFSESQIQTLVDGLTYRNTSQDPTNATRVVTLTSLQDSGGTISGGVDTVTLTAHSNITVVGVNDPPILSATTKTPNFKQGDSAVSLFSGTSISTIESAQMLSQLTLTVGNVSDGSGESLNIDGTSINLTNGSSGTTASNSLGYSVSVTGSNATIALTGDLNIAMMQTLINGITYQNLSSTQTDGNRIVTITSIKDNGGTSNGGVDTTSLSIASTVHVITIPDAPTDVTVTRGDGQATVSFTAPLSNGGSGITSYTVTSNPGGFTATGSSSPLTVTGLTNGTSYTFTVTATNGVGPGAASAASTSVTPAALPTAPTGVTATAGDGQATVSFTAPSSNGGSTITSYTVTSNPGGFTASGTGSPLTVTGLTNGTAYTFTVTATSEVGTGPSSTASNAVTPVRVPGAPTGVTATAGDGQATVSFTAPSSNGGSTITSYTVTSNPGGFTASGTGSPLTVTGLTNGTSYTFTVTSTNGAGTGAESGASTAVIPATLPGVPTDVTAIAGDGQATVNFNAPVSNGGSAITSYTVTSNPGGLTVTGSGSPLLVTGLTNGTAYTFTVTATNRIGSSADSSASSIITPVANSVITPTSGKFDKKASSQADIAITMELNGNTLSNVKNGTATLSFGTDYTISGSAVAILKSYLANQATGTVTLTFNFNAGNPQNFAITVTDSTSSGGSSGGGGSSSSSTTTATSSTVVQVNGESQATGTTANTTNSNGQTVTTVTVDTAKLDKILETTGNKPKVTIPVTANSDVAIAGLTGQMVKNMESKEATLEVKTGSATYTLPATEINIDSVSKQLGQDVKLSDIKVQIQIAEPSKASVKIVENAAKTGDFTIMVAAVNFEISCTYNGKSVDVSKFNSYVERTVAMPDGVDPTKITTGIIVQPDGTVRHVPTQVIKVNGKYYAKMNSLTNSTYTVIWNPITFADVENHWAKDSVNNMGARMVVSGLGNGNYNPNSAITRAEFAAIVVRALGLEIGTGKNQFSDVKTTDWYCNYVETASEYGIINGKSVTTFAPNDKITREQAMAMIARAMKITGLEPTLPESEINELLTNYSDEASSSSYAKSSIASCLKTGVISGTSSSTLAPKNNITRAEVAVIVERLLKKSELI